MNVWDALETLCGERNPLMFVMVEIDDAREIMAVRKALASLVSRPSKTKVKQAKQLLEQR